jgi:hypothetical protein
MSTVPSNPETQKKIRNALSEISDSLTRIAAELDLIKSIIDEKSEEFEIDKKMFRKMAKTFHKDSFSRDVAESEEFTTLYETVVKVTTAPQQGDNDEEN